MQILQITPELFPLIKTGGLADVSGALPAALAEEEVECRTLLPGYRDVLDALEGRVDIWRTEDFFGGPVKLAAGRAADLDLYVLDAPHLYDRDGGVYVDQDGRDWSDNWARFGALCQIGALLALQRVAEYRPDVVHCHDWQAGLTPAYLKLWETAQLEAAPPVVTTIHNIAFQGLFPAHRAQALDLPPSGFSVEGYEYHGHVGYLKAGLYYADKITTVSPTYAREIQSPAFGCGLEGLLRTRAADLEGVVNGADTAVWDPAKDARIPFNYSNRKLSGKAKCKTELQKFFGLEPQNDAPLFGLVSRLTSQKGLDLVLEALPAILEDGGQLALLGRGDPLIEAQLLEAQSAQPGSVAVVLGYDEDMSHLVQAGADFILVPSRYEPCGLTQLYALRYGSPPIVARTGGLADTVIDANVAAREAGVATGFTFDLAEPGGLARAVSRAKALYRDKSAMKTMMRFALGRSVGWRSSAKRYKEIYVQTLLERNAEPLSAPADPEDGERDRAALGA